MNEKFDLTTGNLRTKMIRFALPYLFATFMQTFYGMVDLYVVGVYDNEIMTTAVSIGSQVMHLITVVIVGLAMGTTVWIGQAVGAKENDKARKTIGTTIKFYIIFAIVLTVILLLLTRPITSLMMTPKEAAADTSKYLWICFAGIPFITAYNVISSVFRGIGDSKRPMIFVAIACAVNVGLDFLFVGGFHLGAAGAAAATVCGQAVSVIVSAFVIKNAKIGISLSLSDVRFHLPILKGLLRVGVPIAMQDGLIQVSFAVITIIANSRGLYVSAGVGIVEKIICFMFLVPSAFLSAIAAITAQNIGAGKPERAKSSLFFGLAVTCAWGAFCCLLSQIFPEQLLGLFTGSQKVISCGAQYLRPYSFDCFFAAIHFCFSGYFNGCQKSMISFIHNIISIILIRIPMSYLASVLFPETLLPMGMAAPAGSVLSVMICVGFYVYLLKKEKEKNVYERDKKTH